MDDQDQSAIATAGGLDAVLAAYRQVLNDPEVTADSDFFESGGDSIQVMNAIALIQEMTGVEVSVGMFFIYPTAAELAEAMSVPPGTPS
jgi:acyl carrier protein